MEEHVAFPYIVFQELGSSFYNEIKIITLNLVDFGIDNAFSPIFARYDKSNSVVIIMNTELTTRSRVNFEAFLFRSWCMQMARPAGN